VEGSPVDQVDEPFDPEPFLQTLTHRPGVYRMLDQEGTVIYVGKAKDLRKRVASYFRGSGHSIKTRALVGHIRSIEITVTSTETEALILEQSLIKSHRPRYNVLMRDDKSYPYIHLSEGAYPRLSFHRGARSGSGRFFGPFPTSLAVRESLNLLQKVFRVRQCEDSFFNNRSRPCLQYQIKRCRGPCVGLVSEEDYAGDVDLTRLFLEGSNQQLIDELVGRMEQAAARLEYEEAALLRDQIVSLRRVQERQYVEGEHGDLDIVAIAREADEASIQLFVVRGGRNLGNRSWFTRLPEGSESGEAVAAFLSRYYLERPVPPLVVVSETFDDRSLLERILSEKQGSAVSIRARPRGELRRWLELAVKNAGNALATRLAGKAGMARRYQALAEILELDQVITRMECFDISHTGGEATVASCVVFNHEGPLKSDYRRFSIKGITPGDDYAAMEQALSRRYRRLRDEGAPLPDLLLVDGGKGQLGVAMRVLEALECVGVTLIGVAKGPERKPGAESLLLADGRELLVEADAPAQLLIRHIRDEAHRFAVAGHRGQRGRKRTRSSLEEIPGMGPKRRQQLLRQLGGLQEVMRAGVEDLARVPGISHALAERIYANYHPDEGRTSG
jgi:excinuclease ABC subunit C